MQTIIHYPLEHTRSHWATHPARVVLSTVCFIAISLTSGYELIDVVKEWTEPSKSHRSLTPCSRISVFRHRQCVNANFEDTTRKPEAPEALLDDQNYIILSALSELTSPSRCSSYNSTLNSESPRARYQQSFNANWIYVFRVNKIFKTSICRLPTENKGATSQPYKYHM